MWQKSRSDTVRLCRFCTENKKNVVERLTTDWLSNQETSEIYHPILEVSYRSREAQDDAQRKANSLVFFLLPLFRTGEATSNRNAWVLKGCFFLTFASEEEVFFSLNWCCVVVIGSSWPSPDRQCVHQPKHNSAHEGLVLQQWVDTKFQFEMWFTTFAPKNGQPMSALIQKNVFFLWTSSQSFAAKKHPMEWTLQINAWLKLNGQDQVEFKMVVKLQGEVHETLKIADRSLFFGVKKMVSLNIGWNFWV